MSIFKPFALCLVALVLQLSQSAFAETPPTNRMQVSTLGLVTGSPTGTYFRFGQDIRAMMEQYGLKLDVKESKGSIDNIDRINSAENAALGIVQSDVLGFLTRSENPQSQLIADKLRLVFPFYKEEVHIIANKNIRSLRDLRGKTVVVGPNGSGSWLTAMNLFSITDIKPQKLLRSSPEDGMMEVLLGKADAMIFVAGKPVKLFKNLENLRKEDEFAELMENIHFVPILERKILREYASSTLSKSDYSFMSDDVPTIAVTAVLVSYDFSQENNEYAEARCNQVSRFSAAMNEHLSELRAKGHPKWSEVDLNAELGLWKRDTCSIAQAGAAVSLENVLFNDVKNSNR